MAACEPLLGFFHLFCLGYNYRIDEVRSALGLVQLSKIGENNKKRARIAAEYRKRLTNVPKLSMPFAEHPGKSSYHIFPVLLDAEIDREAVIAKMKDEQIQTAIHYPPVHLFTYVRARLGTNEGLLPLTEKIAKSILTLPLFPDMKIEQVEMVVSVLREQLSK